MKLIVELQIPALSQLTEAIMAFIDDANVKLDALMTAIQDASARQPVPADGLTPEQQGALLGRIDTATAAVAAINPAPVPAPEPTPEPAPDQPPA